MKILDRLPISTGRSSLRFGDRYVTIHADQILVWVSVHLSRIPWPEGSLPKSPAVLDTGNNFGFSLRERHLREWAGIDPGLLEVLGDITVEGRTVARRGATVWLHPNAPGRQEPDDDRPPFRIEMSKGIAVYPSDAMPPGPRLPLVGLSALLGNDLDFWLDPERRHATVRSRDWQRPLVRFLSRW